MKKIYAWCACISIAVISLFTLPLVNSASAVEFRGTDTVTVPENETVDGTLIAVGNSVTIDGTVHGDVFCMGQKVTINGFVDGDVLCAGQSVSIMGDVSGSTRVAGQSLYMTGMTDRNMTLMGQDITIGNETTIGQDLLIFGQSITINGVVGRDIFGYASHMLINGIVERDATIQTMDLVLGTGSAIGGNLTYSAIKEAVVTDATTISGKVAYTPIPVTPPKEKKPMGDDKRTGLMNKVWSAVGAILVSIILMTLFPALGKRLVTSLETRPYKSIFAGVIALFAVPMIIIVSIMTIIGIPLAILLGVGYAAIAYGGKLIVYYSIGKRVLRQFVPKKSIHRAVSAITGIIICSLLQMVPFIGMVFSAFFFLWGTGAVIVAYVTRNSKS